MGVKLRFKISARAAGDGARGVFLARCLARSSGVRAVATIDTNVLVICTAEECDGCEAVFYLLEGYLKAWFLWLSTIYRQTPCDALPLLHHV